MVARWRRHDNLPTMSAMWVAVATTLAGGAVALAGQWLAGRQQRIRLREERIDRATERRATAYAELLRAARATQSALLATTDAREQLAGLLAAVGTVELMAPKSVRDRTHLVWQRAEEWARVAAGQPPGGTAVVERRQAFGHAVEEIRAAMRVDLGLAEEVESRMVAPGP
jgi:hypothetical protein